MAEDKRVYVSDGTGNSIALVIGLLIAALFVIGMLFFTDINPQKNSTEGPTELPKAGLPAPKAQ